MSGFAGGKNFMGLYSVEVTVDLGFGCGCFGLLYLARAYLSLSDRANLLKSF